MVARSVSISPPPHGRSRRMRAIGTAIAQLAGNPWPPEAFHRGDYHRLRVGSYRVMYLVEGDLITIERVDRITGA